MHILRASDINEAKSLAKDALDNHLYVVGWTLQQMYEAIRESADELQIAVAYNDEGKPVGCAVVDDFSGCVEIFVKKNHRRQGIGRALVNVFKEIDSEIYGHYRGAKNAELFFESCGIL